MHNNKLVTVLYEEVASGFDKLNEKRAFAHWYHKAGMEDALF